MTKFCDVEKFKNVYEHQVGAQFDNAIHEMEKDEFCADVVEREKYDLLKRQLADSWDRIEELDKLNGYIHDRIDHAIEEIKQEIQNGTIKIRSGNEKLFDILMHI